MQFQNFNPQQQLMTLFGQRPIPAPQGPMPGFQQWLTQRMQQGRQQQLNAQPMGMGRYAQSSIPMNFNFNTFQNSNPQAFQRLQQVYARQQGQPQMQPNLSSLFGRVGMY